MHPVKSLENFTEEEEDNIIKNLSTTNGDREYALCLKKALKEAIDENEIVNYFFYVILFCFFLA